MSFIHDNFLLTCGAAERLYHEYAKPQPIIDYHCHLPPDEVAVDKRWDNLGEIWLGGDHYKWRAMRANGVDEVRVTGSASWRDKFNAWSETVPHTLRNPLHHWTHLELKRYFDIDELLSPETADRIWEETSAQLAQDSFSALNILRRFDVRLVGTTDDPCDSLEHHADIAKKGIPTQVVPTFRPDKAMQTSDPIAWNAWINRLSEAAGMDISGFGDVLAALQNRHDYFATMGCRLSDHGLEKCPYAECQEAEAASIFSQLRSGSAIGLQEQEKWATFILAFVARLNAAKGWTMQLHLGALRNQNRRMLGKLGPDTGFDSILDEPQVRAINRFLDSLDQSGELPKTILYNLDPATNYAFATVLGNFQDGSTAGKIQFGSGWWHLDQMEGMTWQLNALSNLGLLSRFVGMLTDSRSFLSYPRHEYFRRLLCRILGSEMEDGLLPPDFDLVGQLVKRVCFGNAATYFGFDLQQES